MTPDLNTGPGSLPLNGLGVLAAPNYRVSAEQLLQIAPFAFGVQP
jgi:hypothetical protein